MPLQLPLVLQVQVVKSKDRLKLRRLQPTKNGQAWLQLLLCEVPSGFIDDTQQ
jgi:hypothetical protein